MPTFLTFPFLSTFTLLSTQTQKFSHISLFININNHSRFGSIHDQYIRFNQIITHIFHIYPPNLINTIISLAMPSMQKIVLALAFVASAFAAQISDGQLQQPTTTPAIIPVVNQITDGQIQQVTSTPVAVVAPAVKQITDGQIQQASASITPSVSANATSVTTPSVTAFKGAASLMSYSSELVAVAIGAAAVFAML